jgi:hypothetical protein
MAEQITPELVVSSWPFRLGTIVYDPALRIDVASWDLDEVVEQSDFLPVAARLLNPLRPYRKRSEALIGALTSDQELLRAVYQVDEEEDVRIEPVPSDDVERELAAWLKPRDLSMADISLRNLPELLDTLASWPIERHHSFCADWWETFEQPASAAKPSVFRIQAAPGGRLYNAAFSLDTAMARWREDCDSTEFSEFSLWQALRAHYAWRLEFASEPAPTFPVLTRLEQLFTR